MNETSSSLGDSLQSAILQMIDASVDCLRGSRTPDAATTHEARKRLKEARALLRLVESSFPGGRLTRLVLRDSGRELAARRDADAVVECLDKLIASLETSAGEAEEVDALRESLMPRRTQSTRGLASLRVSLGAARSNVERWHAETLTLEDVQRGVRATYTATRERMFDAACTRRPTAFHEWRKRAKEQWYQVLELAGHFPDIAPAHEGSLRQLSRTLGDHHDIVLLLEKLASMKGESALRTTVEALATDRLRELEDEALALGWILFRPTPAKWMRRFENLARAAADGPGAPAQIADETLVPKEAENGRNNESVVPHKHPGPEVQP